jgi:Large ribosomal RNA subunit accumulation protein YceD
MKTLLPEFSRTFEVVKLSNTGSHQKLVATNIECAALAKRMQISAILSLTATLHAKPWRGGGVKVSGQLKADLEQVSVISLESFREIVSYDVDRYFMPRVKFDASEEELVIDPIEGGIIDLGEVVAETLALELDPYPRKPGEAFAETIEDFPDVPANPFAGLGLVEKTKPGK